MVQTPCGAARAAGRVPFRSPLRYPGGKTWLVPTARRWLQHCRPGLLVEPFAGGGSISLTAAFEGLAAHVLMVELDPDVAAVWQTALGDNASWLADRIAGFQLTVGSARAVLGAPPPTVRERAFQTIIRNRVGHRGCMAPGCGWVRRGEFNKGITDRWYPKTIARRIRDLAQVRGRVEFVRGDGLEVMERLAGRTDAAWFVDPPYTVSRRSPGARLYPHSRLDHGRLFRLAARASGDLLMTHEDDPAVVGLAAAHDLDTRRVAMRTGRHEQKTELLIGRDLGWVGREELEQAA
ncbi:MAG: DNA methyltransferase [Isosphaera sp.]|nr:DNA methyltransferase [Isosphaera sp.]